MKYKFMTKFKAENKHNVQFLSFLLQILTFSSLSNIAWIISLRVIMEKLLKYVLMLSLKEMSLRRVAVVLWSDSDILDSITPLCFSMLFPETIGGRTREAMENKVKVKVSKLKLPESLTKQMIDIIQPIGVEIKRWKELHQSFLGASNEEISLPDSGKLCWTTAGTIDNRKTAEKLVRWDVLDGVRRYQLACLYCLEDYIPLLWEELPEAMKEHFCREKSISPDLHYCWSHILTGELSKLDYLLRTSNRNLTSFNQWAFEDSAETGNKTAAEYFFQKLTHEERGASLMRTAHAVVTDKRMDSWAYSNLTKERLSDVFFYLLSLMNPEQQMEIFKAQPIDVLLCFLDWPWQDLFLENAGLVWTSLSPSVYGDLLWKMAGRFDFSDYYFPKLFRELFIQSPLDLKKCFVCQESEFGGTRACRLLSIFFTTEDSESIEVIFRNMDAADRTKLVLQHHVLDLFYKSISLDRWHMVEVCLREANLSKEDRETLKGAFMEFLKSIDIGQIEWENPKWKRFFEFLDETDGSRDEEKRGQKRKLENCCPE